MATASIRVMSGGQPVAGAKLTIGEAMKELTTDEEGLVSKTVPEDWGPVAVQIIIECDDPKIAFGGGPYKIIRDEELVIEV